MTLEQRQSKRLTMAHIAKEAGVSTTTVSKVLNQLPGVGAETRARIQELIEQNDYVQNHAARLLRKERNKFVAIVIIRLKGRFALRISNCVLEAESQDQSIHFALCEDGSRHDFAHNRFAQSVP